SITRARRWSSIRRAASPASCVRRSRRRRSAMISPRWLRAAADDAPAAAIRPAAPRAVAHRLLGDALDLAAVEGFPYFHNYKKLQCGYARGSAARCALLSE